MNGTIDDYQQMRVFLSEEEVKTLEERGFLIGGVGRTDSINVHLRINYVNKDHVIKDELPKDEELRRRGGYEIYLSRRGLTMIKTREVVGQEFIFEPEFFIRKVYISLEDVL